MKNFKKVKTNTFKTSPGQDVKRYPWCATR